VRYTMTSEYRAFNLLLGAVLIVIAVAPFLVEIPESGIGNRVVGVHPPICFVRAHTGEQCPGCGLTRSVVALYNGDWALSRSYHPAGAVVVGVLLAELCLRLVPLVVARSWMLWADLAQIVLAGFVVRWSL